MTYEIYRSVFIGGVVFSTIMFLISVTLFFVFKIPKIIGNLSGSTAKKAIRQIREQNEYTGALKNTGRTEKTKRKKLHNKTGTSGAETSGYHPSGSGAWTEKISTQLLDQKAMAQSMLEETTLLSPVMEETTVLSHDPAAEAGSVFVVEQDITFIHTEEYITA